MELSKYGLKLTQVFTFGLLYAQNTLAQFGRLDVDGVDTDNEDPVELGYQILQVIGTFLLVLLGFILLVIIIKELIKQVNEARDDGKWGKVAGTALGGFVVILIVAWLSVFAASII